MKAIIIDGKLVRGVVTKYHLQRLGIVVEHRSSIKAVLSAVSGQNSCSRSGIGMPPGLVLIEKDCWMSNDNVVFPELLLDLKHSGRVVDHPKLILLANSMTNAESLKAKAAGFSDTIVKPLRASMVAACLQQVLGIGSRRLQGKEFPNGSAYLHSILSGKNILVVDDNRVNRIVAAGALKKFGAKVECAESGRAALEFLQLPHKFDACFMDIQMPEMDGFEATRQIRQMETRVNELMENGGSAGKAEIHMPILAMTADVFQATYQECLKCGMDGYVSKPFEEENLYQAVAKFFEPKSISDS